MSIALMINLITKSALPLAITDYVKFNDSLLSTPPLQDQLQSNNFFLYNLYNLPNLPEPQISHPTSPSISLK